MYSPNRKSKTLTCAEWAISAEFIGLEVLSPVWESFFWTAEPVTREEFIEHLRTLDIRWNLEKL
jgi:hypothetical protein